MNDLHDRLANTNNKWQGGAKRVLCVCSAGLLRSPTAANVLHQHWGHNTRSCGTSPDYALIELDEVLLTWAQEVVCMDAEQQGVIGVRLDGLDLERPVRVLGIKDCFGWDDHTLRESIKDAYAAFEEAE